MAIKQVIVMRADLKMRRGKEIAQGSHASMAFITRQLPGKVHLSDAQKEWLSSSFAKICVRVDSEEELMQIAAKAEELGITCHIITDSGKTEFNGVPTKTCLALGPDHGERLDKITGNLRLY